jgi:hypothetical protein
MIAGIALAVGVIAALLVARALTLGYVQRQEVRRGISELERWLSGS